MLTDLDKNTTSIISSNLAWDFLLVPYKVTDDVLHFYSTELNEDLREELEIIHDKKIEFTIVSRENIVPLLNKFYKKEEGQNKVISANNTVNFLDDLINEAKNINSSDIHIESYEDDCRVRYRIDGKLIERYIIFKEDYPSFINKIKIKSNLDIAEKRLPQDGRILHKIGKDKLDIRVSVLPTLHGEKVVMRLLNNNSIDVDIKQLGFEDNQLLNYLEGIKKPNGIILISGPTGSGKTTTLYATLKLLNKKDTNIVTIEDPIEYTLEGVNQVQLKEEVGLTFARALRTFLRQDPDIIMLGEIRDGETANMAIRASLTGHLVLSTIHTNSAWGTISRLIDMGVPPFLLASTINTSVAQRLVRKLCTNCKKQQDFKSDMLPKTFVLPQKIEKVYVPVGCDKCHYTGYKGRCAVYEVISFDQELGELIKIGNFDVRKILEDKGVSSLSSNAFNLLKNGLTSSDEVYSLMMDV